MLLLLPFAQAFAPPVPFADACRLAPVVADVEVTGAEVRWRDDGQLETWYDLAVRDVRKGEVPPDLRVVSRGGTLAGLTEWVEDAPRLEVDHRYLLLLRPRDRGGWTIFGGETGVISLGWQVVLTGGVCDAP